jgi:heptosyltransferase III
LWLQCWPYRWDIIIDLRNSLVSRILSHEQLFIHGKNNNTAHQHKVVQNASIMRLAQAPAPKIWVSETDRAAATALVGDRPVIALGPAANWLPKQWPPAFMAALVELFLADPALAHHRFLVMAAAHEQEQIADVVAAIPPDRLILQSGGSLAIAAASLEQCVLYIGNDSGLMHLAAAMNTPTLGLFGPGYPEIYGPWGAHTAIVRTPESREELLARLPFAGANTPNLMSSISVDSVAAAAYNLLQIGRR